MAHLEPHTLYTQPGSVFNTRPRIPQSNVPRDVCFKIFIVFTTALAALVLVAGILSLMASKEVLPVSWLVFSPLKAIGVINSYLMIGGGVFLLALSIFAWGFQICKEDRALSGRDN